MSKTTIYDASEYHRSVQMSHMRKLMAYDQAQFEADWKEVLAIAQIVSVEGPAEHWELLSDFLMMRIQAWAANHPYDLKF